MSFARFMFASGSKQKNTAVRRNQKLPHACCAFSATTGALPAAQGALSRRYPVVLSRRSRGSKKIRRQAEYRPILPADVSCGKVAVKSRRWRRSVRLYSTEPTTADLTRDCQRDAAALAIQKSLLKHKIHCADHAKPSPEVVPAQGFFHVNDAERHKD